MSFENIPDEDVKKAAIAVGKELHEQEGKQRYYGSDKVQRAVEKVLDTVDLADVTLQIVEALFTSKDDFEKAHEGVEDACDYSEAKEKAVHAVTDGASDSWFDVDMSWLEWPDIELPNVFDFLDF
jgi:hypothetical protein